MLRLATNSMWSNEQRRPPVIARQKNVEDWKLELVHGGFPNFANILRGESYMKNLPPPQAISHSCTSTVNNLDPQGNGGDHTKFMQKFDNGGSLDSGSGM